MIDLSVSFMASSKEHEFEIKQNIGFVAGGLMTHRLSFYRSPPECSSVIQKLRY